ncbi:MAG: class I poly(R)-hydroxyalkanoic acid synthase [Rhodobacteraceae bacterium]|nr:class I poly(R)-hydroxyalkanoic acid synthase [Paracoccaceae bacterium]
MGESKVHSEKFNNNMIRIEELSVRLMEILAKKEPIDPATLHPDSDTLLQTGIASITDVFINPTKIFENQVQYWGKSMELWLRTNESLMGSQSDETSLPQTKDNRFKSEHWNNPYFNLIKEQYLLNAKIINRYFENLQGLDESQKRKIEFFSHQVTDLLSPANFLPTNPEALQKAIDTEGQSLVDGLENLVKDLERNDGDLIVTLADTSAFKVGDNIALSEGKVVARNKLFELLQYSPKTETVKELPLLVIPPWINKYYVLDLRHDNSFINYMVEQGFTVFVVSWNNPDESFHDVGMDTYVLEGSQRAINETLKLSHTKQLNAVGYCIGGTLLAMTMAYQNKMKVDTIHSATFFTTLTDFEDAGELGIFISDEYLAGIDHEIKSKGYFPGKNMSQAFSYLRANDLVYGPAIRSYLMGEPPKAFDLLYWNSDTTNLPGRMAKEYFYDTIRGNTFAKGQTIVNDVSIGIADITQPFIAIACEADHLVNWKTSFNGLQKAASKEKNYILAESGHIAGIINPPTKKKYGHFINPNQFDDFGEWRAKAQYSDCTWWGSWMKWLALKSGPDTTAREIDADRSLGDAPGQYVLIPAAK